MTSVSNRLRNYAELGRISNLPTVWTNALTGVAVGSLGAERFPWIHWTVVAIAVSLMYVAGMVMNDLVDYRVDREERPNRPLPSGRVSFNEAWTMIFAGFAGGLGLLTALSVRATAAGAALLLAIILYNVTHRRFAASIILMGLCRGLVYIVGAVAIAEQVGSDIVAALAVSITVYITLITLVARSETEDRLDWRRFLAFAQPFVALAPGIVIHRGAPSLIFPLGGIVFIWLIWVALMTMRRPPQTKRAVMAWLAGICLLDAYFLSLLDRPIAVGIAFAAFIVTMLGHRRIIGT